MSNLDKQVLVLNKSWQPINVMTAQKALVMMSTDVATAMDFSDEGYFVPVRWKDWLELPEWKNLVLADRRINNIRGNRSLEEAGLTLKVEPHVPAAKPFHELVRARLEFPEWELFVKK